jgi:hypothetical protein
MGGPGKRENLTPWKPGQSGNPGGRPSKRPITERYAKFADLPVDEKTRKAMKLDQGATLADAATKRLYQGAIEGDYDALREIREGIEGKGNSLANAEISLNEAVADTERSADDPDIPTFLKPGALMEVRTLKPPPFPDIERAPEKLAQLQGQLLQLERQMNLVRESLGKIITELFERNREAFPP